MASPKKELVDLDLSKAGEGDTKSPSKKEPASQESSESSEKGAKPSTPVKQESGVKSNVCKLKDIAKQTAVEEIEREGGNIDETAGMLTSKSDFHGTTSKEETDVSVTETKPMEGKSLSSEEVKSDVSGISSTSDTKGENQLVKPVEKSCGTCEQSKESASVTSSSDVAPTSPKPVKDEEKAHATGLSEAQSVKEPDSKEEGDTTTATTSEITTLSEDDVPGETATDKGGSILSQSPEEIGSMPSGEKREGAEGDRNIIANPPERPSSLKVEPAESHATASQSKPSDIGKPDLPSGSATSSKVSGPTDRLLDMDDKTKDERMKKLMERLLDTEESQLYGKQLSQEKRLKIEVEGEPKVRNPRLEVIYDAQTRFHVLLDVSRFRRDSVVVNLLGDAIEVYAKEEIASGGDHYSMELHELNQVFPIPDYVDRSGFTAVINQDEMLHIKAPVKATRL